MNTVSNSFSNIIFPTIPIPINKNTMRSYLNLIQQNNEIITYGRFLLNNNSTPNLSNNPQFISENLALDLIGLTSLRNDSEFYDIRGSNPLYSEDPISNKNFTIVVIDTGVWGVHEQLRNNFTGYINMQGKGKSDGTSTGYLEPLVKLDTNGDNIISQSELEIGNTKFIDNSGHGTLLGGTIASSNPQIGIATDVNLIGIRVGESNNISLYDIAESLKWCYQNCEQYNIVCVNISLGCNCHYNSSEGLGGAITSNVQNLESKGVVVVAGAGNNYIEKHLSDTDRENITYPSIISSIAVGAVWKDNNRQDEIAEEWDLNTRELVKKKDTPLYSLLTNPKYNFPKVIPNGKYRK